MTDITVDNIRIRDLILESGQEHPDYKPPRNNLEKKILTQFVEIMIETPALAVPIRDIIYLHGKVPEDYVEMILTHELLHIVIQQQIGYHWQKSKNSPDKVVDTALMNALLCRVFNVEQRKFFKWLTCDAACKGWASWIILRVIWLIGRRHWFAEINQANSLWDDE